MFNGMVFHLKEVFESVIKPALHENVGSEKVFLY